MFQKLLASKHYRLRDSKSRPKLGRVEVCVWSPTKLKKNKKPRCGWNRALKLTVTHTVRLRFCYFFIFTQTLVQLVKRDMVTAVIYCYITTEFHYAGETWLAAFHSCGFSLQVLASSSPVTLLFTHFDEPKNSLKLANPTRPEYSHMFN